MQVQTRGRQTLEILSMLPWQWFTRMCMSFILALKHSTEFLWRGSNHQAHNVCHSLCLKGLEMSVAYCNQKPQKYFFPFLSMYLFIYLFIYILCIRGDLVIPHLFLAGQSQFGCSRESCIHRFNRSRFYHCCKHKDALPIWKGCKHFLLTFTLISSFRIDISLKKHGNYLGMLN